MNTQISLSHLSVGSFADLLDTDEYSTGHNVIEDGFMTRVNLNILQNWKSNYSGESFFKLFVEKYGVYENRVGWLKKLRKLEEEFLKDNPDYGSTTYLPYNKFIDQDWINKNIIDPIIEIEPALGKPPMIDQTTRTLAELLELTHAETMLLQFAVECKRLRYPSDYLLPKVRAMYDNLEHMYASMFQCPRSDIKKALDGFLVQSGFIVQSSYPEGFWMIAPVFEEAFDDRDLTPESIEHVLFPHSATTELSLDDFEHIKPEIDRSARIIQKALDQKTIGSNIILWGPAGTGKCLDPEELVMKYDGSIVKNKELKVGDQLMGPDSYPRNVLSTSWGRGLMYEVVPVKGKPWKCNGDHILSLRASYGNRAGEISFFTVEEWLKLSTTQKKIWKQWRPECIEFSHKELSIDPYFIGIMIGDGTLQHKISCHSVDKEIVDFVYEQAEEYGMVVREWKRPNRNIEYGIVSGPPNGGKTSELREKFRTLDMFQSCASKFIPHDYKTASIDARLNVLAGLLDTDGHYDGNGFDFVSKSKILADDVAFIARSLGFSAYVKEVTKSSQNGTRGIYYRLFIAGDVDKIPTRIIRKKASARRQIKKVTNTGFDIRPIGEGDYFGITLDGDHQYLLEDFTVTHNTELALTMAKDNGWKIRSIGDISAVDNGEKSRAQRIGNLKIALKLFANDRNTVLLFDEIEDLFKVDTNAAFSKAFINRIIETTPVPIIWTTNSLLTVGSPVLRRMTYNINCATPPKDTRRRMWQKYATQFGVKLDDDTQLMLDEFDIPPALIKNAMQVTGVALSDNSTSEEVRDIVCSLDRLVNYGFKRRFEMPEKDDLYDATCTNADRPLEEFTKRLVESKNRAFTLCLYGPPGTGKTKYGRYLAAQMGQKVLVKRASDLLDKYLGGTEEKIAEAFAEAKDEKSILLIDEGDTFLRDRTKARHSWEVSQVNEMLSQMESHPQPFILTTNLMDDLDPASLRRFSFKLKFDFMTTDQAKRLFIRYFGNEAPDEIERNDILTPGDYANVKKQVEFLEITDPNEIYKLLVEECTLKPQKRLSIGF